jgi:hypothetical protein
MWETTEEGDVMQSDNAKRLELALRKNRGRRLVAEFSLRLSQAFDVEVCASSFLSIEETGELKTAFYSIVRDERRAVRTFWRKTQSDDLIAHLLEMRKIARSPNAIVFSSVDRFIGAVRVPADCVLRNAMVVWQVVGEDLSLATDDLHDGLCLEETFYTAGAEYVREGLYELTAWGVFAIRCEQKR